MEQSSPCALLGFPLDMRQQVKMLSPCSKLKASYCNEVRPVLLHSQYVVFSILNCLVLGFGGFSSPKLMIVQ